MKRLEIEPLNESESGNLIGGFFSAESTTAGEEAIGNGNCSDTSGTFNGNCGCGACHDKIKSKDED